MNQMSSYEKQLLWKLASNKKAEKLRSERLSAAEPSFQPKFFVNNAKKSEGHVRELTEASGQRHVARQTKARKERAGEFVTGENPPISSPDSTLNNDTDDYRED